MDAIRGRKHVDIWRLATGFASVIPKTRQLLPGLSDRTVLYLASFWVPCYLRHQKEDATNDNNKYRYWYWGRKQNNISSSASERLCGTLTTVGTRTQRVNYRKTAIGNAWWSFLRDHYGCYRSLHLESHTRLTTFLSLACMLVPDSFLQMNTGEGHAELCLVRRDFLPQITKEVIKTDFAEWAELVTCADYINKRTHSQWFIGFINLP